MANKLITSAMLEEIKLQHYGVKGMKWGVRKEYEPVPETTTMKRNKLLQKIKNDKVNKIGSYDKINKFNPSKETISDAARNSNEGFRYMEYAQKKDFPNTNYTENTYGATYAFELRRRGYAVEAGLTDAGSYSMLAGAFGMSDDEFKEELEDSKYAPGDESSYLEALKKSLAKEGIGARGICFINLNGIRDMYSYEVDSNGEVVFINALTGNTYKPEFKNGVSINNPFKKGSIVNTIRTDNKKINTTKSTGIELIRTSKIIPEPKIEGTKIEGTKIEETKINKGAEFVKKLFKRDQ
jgi:hypothetical protein